MDIQKSLSYFINESSDNKILDPKGYDVKKRYDYWNKVAFDGELPKLTKVGWKKLKNAGGVTESTVFSRGNKITSYSKIEVWMSSHFQFNQVAFDETLLHEMVHVWAITIRKYKANHGSVFLNKAIQIGKKVGFAIPLTETAPVIDNKKIMFCIHVNRNVGKQSVALLSIQSSKKFPNILDFVTEYAKSFMLEDGTVIHYGLANTNLHNTLPVTRGSKKALYRIDGVDFQWEEKNEIIVVPEMRSAANKKYDWKGTGLIVEGRGRKFIKLFSEKEVKHKNFMSSVKDLLGGYGSLISYSLIIGVMEGTFDKLLITTSMGKNKKMYRFDDENVTWIDKMETTVTDFVYGD